MKICVALCTYNGSAYVREQLASLAAQRRLPDHLVVVDDRSSDETVEIVRDFAGRAPFSVRIVVNEQNLGYVKNFEKAIRLCDGDLIALADQDDVWHEDKLKVAEDILRSSPYVGLVFSDAEVVDERLRPLGYRLWETLKFDAKRQKCFLDGRATDVLLNAQMVTGATMCFRAKFRDLVLPIPAEAIHDGWIALLIAAVADVVAVDRPLMLYRQHGSNQIGAAPLGIVERLQSGIHRVDPMLPAWIVRFTEAQKRLRGSRRAVRHPRIFAQLEEKVQHLRVREALPESRLRRVPSIFREGIQGRYARHSNGMMSMVKDLLLR
jgi:hypothetical protein